MPGLTVPIEQLVVTAVLAGLVALATASWRIGQEERAKRRAAAREELRARVAPTLRELLAYRDRLISGRNAEQSYWDKDYFWGARVLNAVDRLGTLRRRAAHRRMRKLLPPKAFRMALVTEEADIPAKLGNRAITVMEHEAFQEEWTGPIFDPAEHDTGGLVNTALLSPRDSPELDRAIRLAQRVAAAWWL